MKIFRRDRQKMAMSVEVKLHALPPLERTADKGLAWSFSLGRVRVLGVRAPGTTSGASWAGV